VRFDHPNSFQRPGRIAGTAAFPLSSSPPSMKSRPESIRFGGLLHVLGGNDALVVFPQDDVDRAAQLRKQENGVDAHRQKMSSTGAMPRSRRRFNVITTASFP
jgi:hypothetical protein